MKVYNKVGEPITANTLVNGDCLEMMKYIPDGSVDLVASH